MRSTIITVPFETCPIDQLVAEQSQIGNVQVYFSQQCMETLWNDCEYGEIDENTSLLNWCESDGNGEPIASTEMKVTACKSDYHPTIYRLEWIKADDIKYQCRTTDTFGRFIFKREGENIETKN